MKGKNTLFCLPADIHADLCVPMKAWEYLYVRVNGSSLVWVFFPSQVSWKHSAKSPLELLDDQTLTTHLRACLLPQTFLLAITHVLCMWSSVHYVMILQLYSMQYKSHFVGRTACFVLPCCFKCALESEQSPSLHMVHITWLRMECRVTLLGKHNQTPHIYLHLFALYGSQVWWNFKT